MTRCAYSACDVSADHCLLIVPEGESGRPGRVVVCAGHVVSIRRDAFRIMAACLAHLGEQPAHRYRVIDVSPATSIQRWSR